MAAETESSMKEDTTNEMPGKVIVGTSAVWGTMHLASWIKSFRVPPRHHQSFARLQNPASSFGVSQPAVSFSNLQEIKILSPKSRVSQPV